MNNLFVPHIAAAASNMGRYTNRWVGAARIIAIMCGCVALPACTRQEEPDRQRLLDIVLEHSYPSIYKNLSELRKDYPGFTPKIRHWNRNVWFLFGLGIYAVHMPEELVLVDQQGKVQKTFSCVGEQAICDFVAPSRPELVVIGTVQGGPPDYPGIDNFTVRWTGAPGTVHIVGNCFAAQKAANEPLELTLDVPGRRPIVIKDTYGGHLVSAIMSSELPTLGRARIPVSLYQGPESCSESARQAWPNLGWISRKR